jgi:hypothetical protein
MLAASIQPHAGLPDAALQADARSREQDYIACFKFYLRSFPQLRKVVFADNSGWSLDNVRDAVSRDAAPGTALEFVSFQANDFPGVYAKGYGEALLIDRALGQSTLLATTPYFAKMTGRHCLRNLTDIVEKTTPGFDLLCDLRDHGIYEMIGSSRCGRHFDTRFFVASRALYDRHFRKAYESHRSGGYSIEGEFYRITKRIEHSERVVCRFPVEPIYSGLSGHGKSYDSLPERSKRLVRSLTRRAMPGLRI